MKNVSRWILSFAFGWMGLSVHASPPPGTYDLYNGAGQKTGVITSELKKFDAGTQLTVTTRMEIFGVTKTYRFTETENVTLSTSGVISFRRESDEEGKKSFCEGSRANGNLVVRCDRKGIKLVTAFSLSSFDLTEFEMDLPGSPFRNIKPNESKSQRILFIDRMSVVKVSRNVSPPQTLPTNDGEAPVLIMNAVIEGKPTTSWFHAASGELLQEEGPDYLLTRVHP